MGCVLGHPQNKMKVYSGKKLKVCHNLHYGTRWRSEIHL